MAVAAWPSSASTASTRSAWPRCASSAPRSAEIERSEERVFLPGQANPVVLRRNSNALFLLQRVRDEAHRFAITYHRKLRSQQTLYSALDRIPGVGGVRKRALLRAFGSVKRIEAASLDELLKVPSMNEKLAQQVLDALRGQADSENPAYAHCISEFVPQRR